MTEVQVQRDLVFAARRHSYPARAESGWGGRA